MMDWVQFVTFIGAILGSVIVFYHLTNERINRMELYHREDSKSHKEDMQKIDEKWERLFERLLLQDQKKQ